MDLLQPLWHTDRRLGSSLKLFSESYWSPETEVRCYHLPCPPPSLLPFYCEHLWFNFCLPQALFFSSPTKTWMALKILVCLDERRVETAPLGTMDYIILQRAYKVKTRFFLFTRTHSKPIDSSLLHYLKSLWDWSFWIKVSNMTFRFVPVPAQSASPVLLPTYQAWLLDKNTSQNNSAPQNSHFYSPHHHWIQHFTNVHRGGSSQQAVWMGALWMLESLPGSGYGSSLSWTQGLLITWVIALEAALAACYRGWRWGLKLMDCDSLEVWKPPYTKSYKSSVMAPAWPFQPTSIAEAVIGSSHLIPSRSLSKAIQ